MAKRKLGCFCDKCGEFVVGMRKHGDIESYCKECAAEYRKICLTPLALDAAIQPPAEHVQNSDIIPAGEVDTQPRQ